MDAEARLRELGDFAGPWSLWVAATLGVPDRLRDGPLDVEALAARCGADPGALRRLLAYLVRRGVFAEQDGRYANTELSDLLLDEHGRRSWLDLDGAPGVWAESWTRLLEAVRTGSPGRSEGWFYDELARSGRGASFDALMERRIGATADQLAAAYDWPDVAHVVDVGGGTGRLLQTLLAAHPRLTGTLFDLPQVVAGVEGDDRLAVVAGDLRTDPLPEGDVHILSGVLHGWPDEDAVRVLARSASAAGRVLVVESTAVEPAFDLFMLTLVGGRERSLEDFRRLGAACGLDRCVELPLPGTGHSVVELSR